MTVNSRDASTICVVIRRMNALSSTTSTRGSGVTIPASRLENTRALSQRPHLDSSGENIQIDAATVVAASVFGDDRHLRIGEHVAHGHDITFADVDPTGGDEVAEHARSADDLGRHTLGTRAQPMHFGQHEGYRRRGKLGGIRL